jgi:CO dehydrogenase maturation factor
MSNTIAISGKGGVGKSTIAALVIRWLNNRGINSVLAVDADANANLHELLGVQCGEAIGTIREEMRDKVNEMSGGISKTQFLELKVHQCLVETKGFDLITMGRPEGPGCYCYANNLLRDILKTLSDNYQFVVIDNEAGMEHLSRRTTQQIDYLLIVSDPTVRGIQTAGRINRLLRELDTRVGKRFLVINRSNGILLPAIEKQIQSEDLELLTTLAEDNSVQKWDAEGKATYKISTASALYQSLNQIMSELLPDL